MKKWFRVIQHKIKPGKPPSKYTYCRTKTSNRQYNWKPNTTKIIGPTFDTYEEAERYANRNYKCFNVQCVFLGDTK